MTFTFRGKIVDTDTGRSRHRRPARRSTAALTVAVIGALATLAASVAVAPHSLLLACGVVLLGGLGTVAAALFTAALRAAPAPRHVPRH